MQLDDNNNLENSFDSLEKAMNECLEVHKKGNKTPLIISKAKNGRYWISELKKGEQLISQEEFITFLRW